MEDNDLQIPGWLTNLDSWPHRTERTNMTGTNSRPTGNLFAIGLPHSLFDSTGEIPHHPPLREDGFHPLHPGVLKRERASGLTFLGPSWYERALIFHLNPILAELESALSLYISDFKLSWTRRPYKEKVKQQNTENLARRGTATQSSTYSFFVAQKAIDGVRYGPIEDAYYSVTAYELSPWWRLDLLDYYEISTVVITASYPDQINGAEIRIGNSTENNGINNPRCAVTSGFQFGQTISYSCGVMVGRYINVVLTGRTSNFALCEVEVYDTENLAHKGTVIQPSTYYIRVAENAIDGIRYGSVDTYCSSTGLEATPWWRLDLLDYYGMITIIITARSDGYLEETNGAEIRIGDSLENNGNNNPICAVISGLTVSTSTVSYACDGMEGRYVNVIIPGPGHVTVCEMEVYGKRVLKKNILRLKFLSSVDAAALSDKILSQLESALSLYISDFKLSWTQRPYKEKVNVESP
ncbi:uncharacterized protein [Paramisgurnus dabryanus]|uniref:uncharacterized protein n=1 Tax=Paramisgurnus dabryanus TaxID=90735 RepID=UPI003CCEFBDB